MLNTYMISYLYAIILLIISNSIYAYSFVDSGLSEPVKNLQIQRKIFLQAEEQLKTHKSKGLGILKKFSAALYDYPLYPYLEYMVLQQSIKDLTVYELQGFVNKYNETPLVKQLEESWLLYNARQKNWQNFLKVYKETDNKELECYFIQAQNIFNKNIHEFDSRIKEIWLNGNSQPQSCNVVFDSWKQRGLMTRGMVWQRIKLAMVANKISFAKYLAINYLDKSELPIVDLWIKVHNNPSFIFHKEHFLKSHPAISEIVVYGILNIAKKDPEKAVNNWYELSKIYTFSERHKNYIIKEAAIALAKISSPNAYAWLNKIHKEYKDQEVYNLQLNLSLKELNWNNIINTYKELPDHFKQQEKWLYWYARALEMQNRIIDSKKILIYLSSKRSYYGFLSSAKLLKPYNFKFKPIVVNPNQINLLLQNKSIQRAYELLKLNRINKASREWNYALKNMVEWELHAAAKIADNLSMPNWAITALSDAKEQDDLSLRFPQCYSRYIVNEAKRNQLDPAWVFAVTRQESAFRPNVKSYAGALGLMQLMPKTGFMVAGRININLRTHEDILDINNNVKLGSKYLQLMLDRYKNVVVATAAYNAGPGRIQKWLPNYDMAADIWVETIPFKDTREYVQNVMTYTVIYQKLLGKNHYLTMPLIKKI